MQNNPQVSPYQTLKIIWGALLGSHFMYAFVLFTVTKDFEGEKGLPNPMFLPLMAAAALVAWGMGFFLFNYFINAEKKKKALLTKEQMASLYFTPMILRLALFEAAAIFGFALAFLSHDFNYFIPGFVINVLLFALNFPSEQKVMDTFKL